MEEKMRVMTKKPLNAETPNENLRTWITDNSVFFKRNQGQFADAPIDISDWKLHIDGLVIKKLHLSFEELWRLPKVEVADTLECSGNSRSLLKEKASGNPWTIGGVGNAIWGGVWLKDYLKKQGCRIMRDTSALKAWTSLWDLPALNLSAVYLLTRQCHRRCWHMK